MASPWQHCCGAEPSVLILYGACRLQNFLQCCLVLAGEFCQAGRRSARLCIAWGVVGHVKSRFSICRLKGCSSKGIGCLRRLAVITRQDGLANVTDWNFMFRRACARHSGAAMDTES